jgi:hypothetical protein
LAVAVGVAGTVVVVVQGLEMEEEEVVTPSITSFIMLFILKGLMRLTVG